jgi:hypothetical protein
MPFCPNCRYEYVEGVETCPECGANLTAGSLAEEVEGEAKSEYVRLITLSDPSAAMVFRGTLNEAGIPVVVQTHGPISGELASVADNITDDYAVVFVPEDRLEEALRIVEEMQSGTTQWPAGMEPEEEEGE